MARYALFTILSHYLAQHQQACHDSFQRLWKQPFTNFFTIAVIGVALTLPATLFIILQNVQGLGSHWQHENQITLYLRVGATQQTVDEVKQSLIQRADIASVTYVSPEQGLQQFEKQTGFAELLSQLQGNPLPPVLLIIPASDVNSPLALNQLLNQLQALPQVDLAQLDMAWVKRLYAMINLLQRFVWVLGGLLSLAVLLIVGNTVRLAIHTRRREIEITKLVGATNGFIRRPFLYMGVIYGFFGALFAYLLVNILLLWLRIPVNYLASLYQSEFYVQGFHLLSTEILFIVSMTLGFLGAWGTVAKHLNYIEPS